MDEEPGTTKDDATKPESTPSTIPTPPPAREKYGLSQVQLTQIMDFNDKSGIKKVQQYGGVEDIANHLRTNLKDGLPADPSDHEERKREFGINYIEPIPPKSFLALMYDAIQDPVLLILLGKMAGVFGCCIYYSFPLALSSLSFFFSPSSFFPLPFSPPSSSLSPPPFSYSLCHYFNSSQFSYSRSREEHGMDRGLCHTNGRRNCSHRNSNQRLHQRATV